VRAATEDEVRAVFGRFVVALDLRAVDEILTDTPQFFWITRGVQIWAATRY
jgi:hypothetical protein